jgi:septal ring-binding cell division protein DamX
MTDETRETQQELFEEFSAGGPKKQAERFPSIAKTQKPILISTTLEQLLMTGILSVLLLCGIFFLGVLRGKSLQRPIMAPPASRVAAPVARSAPPPISATGAGQTRIAPATAAPAPRQPAQVALAPDKPYTIQIVTHRKQELAEQEVAKLRRMGYVSFIIPSGDYFQVCAGQYANKEEARRDLSFFASRFKDCFLRHR